jgi:hypothetical protein
MYRMKHYCSLVFDHWILDSQDTQPSLIMCNNNIDTIVSGRRLLSFHRMHMYFTASMSTASASLQFPHYSLSLSLSLYPYSCLHFCIILVVVDCAECHCLSKYYFLLSGPAVYLSIRPNKYIWLLVFFVLLLFASFAFL